MSDAPAAPARDAAADLRAIAFLLERANESTYRVRSFRGAAKTVAALRPDELTTRAAAGTLAELPGVGDVTARCIIESLAGEVPVYLRRLQATEGSDVGEAAQSLRAALRGDCHLHSDGPTAGRRSKRWRWPPCISATNTWLLTDHSPRLTVARGLTADRLREQLDLVEAITKSYPTGFRILTGIEVDINADGSLDQVDELLGRLDVRRWLGAQAACVTTRT